MVARTITLASVASMVLGAGAAAHDGPLSWGWLALSALGVAFIEAGNLLTRADRAKVAAGAYALGIASGLVIVLLREPAVLVVGIAGVGLAYFYQAPPLKLSYRGLGEPAVALAYGPLIATGTYLVQRGTVSVELLAASIPLAAMIGAFLWINELRDRKADAREGKRTLVVQLGAPAAARVFTTLIQLAYAAVLLLPLMGLPKGVWLGLAGLPHGVAAGRRLLASYEESARIVPAEAWTLLSFLLLALGMGLGMALMPHLTP